MITSLFPKIESSCGSVYLLDENLCLKNSYPIINTNVEALSAKLNVLNEYGNDFNLLYNNFAANSAKWIVAINNWESLSARWLNAETVAVNLSAYWQKSINIVYTQTINLLTYYNNVACNQNTVRSWLNQNFLPFFSENQTVTVDLYLTHDFAFNWSFFYQYFENCVPPNTSFSGNCNCPRPSHNCNSGVIDGKKFSGCRNAGKSCRVNNSLTFRTGTENIFCPNFNNGTNSVSFNGPSFDRAIARIINLKYRKQNNTFQFII
jgi:hypothetical protein